MKNLSLFLTLLLVGLLLSGCGRSQSTSPEAGDVGDFANWEAWSITWTKAETYIDVTVKIEDKQKTYLPEPKNSVFLAVQAEILNIGQETEQMRFPQGPIFLEDRQGNKYDMVGLANRDTILMARPYLLVDKGLIRNARWDDGRFFTVAYQNEEETWFIQATPGALFHLDFLFVIPKDASEFLLHFGNGMLVNVN